MGFRCRCRIDFHGAQHAVTLPGLSLMSALRDDGAAISLGQTGMIAPDNPRPSSLPGRPLRSPLTHATEPRTSLRLPLLHGTYHPDPRPSVPVQRAHAGRHGEERARRGALGVVRDERCVLGELEHTCEVGSHAVGCGLWAVGCGLWAVGCGLWTLGYSGGIVGLVVVGIVRDWSALQPSRGAGAEKSDGGTASAILGGLNVQRKLPVLICCSATSVWSSCLHCRTRGYPTSSSRATSSFRMRTGTVSTFRHARFGRPLSEL
jgi:hypothetical protein